MNTITFTWNSGLWAYDSDSDDPLGVGTKTGTYVLASDANERIKVLEDAATKVCICRMNYSKRGVSPALEEYQAMMQALTELARVLGQVK